jgi:hypothetical protein
LLSRRQEDESDHVEVTYEGSTHAEPRDAFETFEEGPITEIDDEIVDLKSLGALETNE